MWGLISSVIVVTLIVGFIAATAFDGLIEVWHRFLDFFTPNSVEKDLIRLKNMIDRGQ